MNLQAIQSPQGPQLPAVSGAGPLAVLADLDVLPDTFSVDAAVCGLATRGHARPHVLHALDAAVFLGRLRRLARQFTGPWAFLSAFEHVAKSEMVDLDAYDLGAAYRLLGLGMVSCPFESDGPERRRFVAGWDEQDDALAGEG